MENFFYSNDQENNSEGIDSIAYFLTSIFYYDIFSIYEEFDDEEPNYELEKMSKEDINVGNQFEIIEYYHLRDYVNNTEQNINYLDKETTTYNLKSLAKLKSGQKLWLHPESKKIDVYANSSYVVRWIYGQHETKIIQYVLLTFKSALYSKLKNDPEIREHLKLSISGIDNLIRMYPTNETLIDFRSVIKAHSF